MNYSTARQYHNRLQDFASFIHKKYKIDIDVFIRWILKDSNEVAIDVYEVLSEYAAYLTGTIAPSTLKSRITTVKNFFEYCGIEISPRGFKLKVKLPKLIKRDKEGLSKETIVDILNACSNMKLKTYVLLLASTGMRAAEALSIRIKDLDLSSNPARLFVRGEFTKTKTDRTVLLTQETSKQLKSWLDFKFRTRRVCFTTIKLTNRFLNIEHQLS